MRPEGEVARGFEPVLDAFAEIVADEGEPAQLAVVVEGRPVVHLWTGLGTDALVHLWSATKPLAALCVLRLVGTGEIELDGRVIAYWPSFGDSTTTVRDLLTHCAGRPAWPLGTTVADLLDRRRSLRVLEGITPEWEPGTASGEHALTYGHLCAGLVGSVDGRSLGSFFAQDIAGPYGLDLHIGVGPDDQGRCADLLGLGPSWRDSVVSSVEFGRTLGTPPGLLDTEVVNGRAWRSGEVGAVNGHGRALDIARLYSLLLGLGPAGGHPILPTEILAETIRPQISGVDRVLEREVCWGLATQVWTDEAGRGFGMGGVGGTSAWAMPDRQLAFAFVAVRMGTHDRADALEQAVLDCR